MSEPLLYHEIHGRGGPFLLLVHGILSSRAQWIPNLEALSTFCRPVVVELFGHGRSPSPEDTRRYAPEGYVAEFEAIRRKLGAERWFLCGQSLGASLTLRYALTHPDRIIAQIFTNSRSALSETASPEVMEALARRLMEEGRKVIEQFPLHPAKSRRMKPEIQRALVADAELIDVRGFASTLRHTVPRTSVLRMLPQNRVPTLLIVGRFDKPFEPLYQEAQRIMPGLELLVLDGGHAVNIDAPEKFNQGIRAFVSRFEPLQEE